MPPAPTAANTASRSGPLPGALGSFCANLYRLAINLRNRRFDRGRGVIRFDRPVISVGNLSVGGTGKTPMVQHLVRLLREAGRHPAVAMRGYRSPAGEGVKSDEALTYLDEFSDLPLVAQPDRVAGLIELFGSEVGERVDTVVLDDGFQHRRIGREVDIVLIDVTRSPFEDSLLPKGWLREPVESLSRASAVVITHAEAAEPERLATLEAEIRQVATRALIASCGHAWSGFTVHRPGGTSEPKHLNWLEFQRVFAACAIGNPQAFFDAARRLSPHGVVGTHAYRDHHDFTAAETETLAMAVKASGADLLLVTAKDWAKLRALPLRGIPCAVPTLELRWESGGDAIEKLVLDAKVSDEGAE
ncbi:MAG: tetraacyldisaccharide 4'-kinase [Phycisphaerales bacterium]|jgi:tetraacyldisaccharide 4'-kinase